MSKRHTSQSEKQSKGQYFTTNCDEILSGYESIVSSKSIIEPFAGGGDLTSWAERNGAVSVKEYDLEPCNSKTIQNDSIANPPDYSGRIVVTNPPYLSKNKFKGNKKVFERWDQNDLYKCHLASLSNGCEEALVIIPSNFLCESSPKARKILFENHYIESAKYWETPIFDDATTGICVLHLKKGKKPFQKFPMIIFPGGDRITMILEEKYGFLHGKDFFEFINMSNGNLRVIKTDVGMNPPNTNLVVGLLDNGIWNNGVRYNDGEPIYCSPKSFTTYQITLVGLEIGNSIQKDITNNFQLKFDKFRNQYKSMFLSNYMGPKQKILSRSYVHKFLEVIMSDMGILQSNNIFEKGR